MGRKMQEETREKKKRGPHCVAETADESPLEAGTERGKRVESENLGNLATVGSRVRTNPDKKQ